MGNVLAPPAAAPQFILDEDSSPRDAWAKYLQTQVRHPRLKAIAERRGSAAEVCAAALAAGGGPRGLTDAAGFGPLHLACACGWDDAVNTFLQAGTLDVNAPSLEGYTPLHCAAMCGNTLAISALLVAGADIGRRSNRGATALHFAAQCAQNQQSLLALLGHPSCSRELVNAKGFRQRSPLLLAVLAHGDAGIVRGLVEAGANPSERCTSMASISVLHTCAHLARVDAMRVLIDAGAQVDSLADDGISVMQEVFMQPPSRQRTEAHKRQMFRMLLEAGANVNAAVPDKNYTVLHFAMASCREEETADLLAESGLDLSIAINKPVLLGDSSAKHTLLHLAAIRGWTRMAARLVAAGADLHQRNKDGLQPLHSAILNSRQETVAELLRLRADPLASCPDCYPSYSKWKLKRGLAAMQALMQADGGGALPALMSLFDDASVMAGPQLTAVDLACCVARHIPTLEAFVERGMLPSPRALQLAEHAVPIMRSVVERPLWTPELHSRLPRSFRRATRELLMCLNRPVRGTDGRPVSLTPDTLAVVLQKAAWPVSQWADAEWLAAQQVREPPPAPEPAAAAAPGGGVQLPPFPGMQQPGGPADGGVGPQVHVLGGDEPMPAFVQAMMQQMQEQLGPMPAGAQQLIIVHQQGVPVPQQQDQQQAAPPQPAAGELPQGLPPALAAMMQQAIGAGPAPAAAAAAAPPGEQGNNHEGEAPQFHIMQFVVDMGFPGGPPPGGPPAAAPMPGGGPPPGFFMQQLFGPGGPAPPQFLFDFNFDDDSDEEEEGDEEGEGGMAWLVHGNEPQALQGQPPAGPAQQQQQQPHQQEQENGEDVWMDAEEGVEQEEEHDQPAAAPASAGAGPSRPPSSAGQDTAGPSASGSKRPASPTSRYNLRSRSKRPRNE